jgi:hypothetical protein
LRPSLKVDQTLSFNDSGYVLCDLLGIRGFQQKVAGLAKSNLVHQGAELAYLLRHDPEFRVVRREHLREVGKRVRLKDVSLVLRSQCSEQNLKFPEMSISERLRK